MEIKEGLVGFFDILGYQEIIINKEIEKTSNFVDNLIGTLPGEVERTIKLKLVNDYKIENMIKWNIFSDTILLNMPFDESDLSFRSWPLFIVTSIYLLRRMFVQGVPLRGGIDYGKYYISDNCIAGKPIVDAFKLCNNQNWTGCCLTEHATDKYRKFYQEATEDWRKLADKNVFKYFVPLKSNPRELYTINWATPIGNASPIFTGTGFRQDILNAFTKNNKQIKPDVIDKINNTELYVSFAQVNIKE
jgi:hypothetical protein